jgi:hypothetical protein
MGVPIIQAVASFQDACLFIATKMHIAPNASAAKKRIAKAIGLPENVSYPVYAAMLGTVLIDNGKKDLVKNNMKRNNLGVRAKGDYIEFYVKK